MTGFGVLRIDFAKSLRDAFAYLSGLGHRRIALLAKDSGEGRKRDGTVPCGRRGFCVRRRISSLCGNTVAGTILRCCGSWECRRIRGCFSFRRGMRRGSANVETLLSLPEPPTALIGFFRFLCDVCDAGTEAAGNPDPEEISVLGLCGYPGGAYLSPTLTTIGYHYERIGWKCLELMGKLERIAQEGGKMPDVIMEHRLIIRESTAGVR